MDELGVKIGNYLRLNCPGRRLKIGIIYRGHRSIVSELAKGGHFVVVAGDKFPRLWRAYRQNKKIFQEKCPKFAEIEFQHIPFREDSFDALVLSAGLPRGERPEIVLKRLSRYLKEDGLLIWPHPTQSGMIGRLGRIAAVWKRDRCGALPRDTLTAQAMQAGLKNIGQISVRGEILPWTVTFGSKKIIGGYAAQQNAPRDKTPVSLTSEQKEVT